MSKYKIIMCYSDGAREEEVFETKLEADEYGLYLCSCHYQGSEILNMSNPGEYPFDEEDEVDFEIIEVED